MWVWIDKLLYGAFQKKALRWRSTKKLVNLEVKKTLKLLNSSIHLLFSSMSLIVRKKNAINDNISKKIKKHRPVSIRNCSFTPKSVNSLQGIRRKIPFLQLQKKTKTLKLMKKWTKQKQQKKTNKGKGRNYLKRKGRRRRREMKWEVRRWRKRKERRSVSRRRKKETLVERSWNGGRVHLLCRSRPLLWG